MADTLAHNGSQISAENYRGYADCVQCVTTAINYMSMVLVRAHTI